MTGNGIASITKTGTSGLVDTYTITYTNGNTTTFTITNGEDGEVTETELNVLRQKVANQQKVIDQLPQVTGQGTSITLENTIEAQFTKFDIEGHSEQETTEGKNKLENKNSTTTLNGITFTPNKDGSITINGTATTGVTYAFGKNNTFFYFNIDTNKVYSLSIGNNTFPCKAFFRITDSADTNIFKQCQNVYNVNTNKVENISGSFFPSGVVCAQLFIYSGETINNFKIYPQLEEGSTATPYEPYTNGASPNPSYEQPIKSAGENGSINEKITNSDGTKEQDYSIPVQQPMRSIGDVRDCFVKKVDGKWYEKHIIGEIVFDGSEDEVWNYESLGQGNNFYINISNAKGGYEIPILSNCFKYYKHGNLGSNYSCRISPTKNLNLRHQDFTNVNDFKTWLSTHNVVVQYELEEPLDLPCTPEQIQQLENIPSTYKEMTIINSEDETEAYLEVSGIYDLNNLINN